MVFSSLTFLQIFLPTVLLSYYLVPKSCKNTVLFLFNLLFYAWGEPVYVGLMIFSTVLDYCCGLTVEKYRETRRAKAGLAVSVGVNLSMLFLFKYADFFIQTANGILGSHISLLNLPLPVGISFYTFQTMSYTIDVYRGDVKAQKNIIAFGVYVSLFPQLIAGPIVRYQSIAEQMTNRVHSTALFAEGVRRFVCGLGKKVLLANNIGVLWNDISKTDTGNLTLVAAWLGILAFAFQIYFDFSGYSDMAIGLGKMFGFTFPENFRYPYISQSITEFWRRWHISMGTWFRDYVYIPLGGNKKGMKKQLRNIAIVWLLTGFWHGASWNYVLWGCFFGVLLVIEKLFLLDVLKKIPPLINHSYTILCLAVSWVFFGFEDISKGFLYLKTMFGAGNVFCDAKTLYQMISYFPLLFICIIAATPLGVQVYGKLKGKQKSWAVTAFEVFGMVSVCLLSMAYLISSSYNPFLYFRF